jgi:hypothetical protein
MSDQLMLTLQAALQQLAIRQTEETLGDRATYLGASPATATLWLNFIGPVHTPFLKSRRPPEPIPSPRARLAPWWGEEVSHLHKGDASC